METADKWKDYELLDTHSGEKLERWGKIITRRPDPQILWKHGGGNDKLWGLCDLYYHRSSTGGGYWENLTGRAPESWVISYGALKFKIKPTDFKHMGLFPEQAVNWNWASGLIKTVGRGVRVLNLFGYTGGATLACVLAGADVTHVDAAKGMNRWAEENLGLSGLKNKKHRVLTDDVMKFIQREKRRGSLYDAIIMDPPAFGRGPSGELWKLEDRLYDLVLSCVEILSENPLFMLLNAYTSGFSPYIAKNVLMCAAKTYKLNCNVTCGEIGLTSTFGKTALPCGLYGRMTFV